MQMWTHLLIFFVTNHALQGLSGTWSKLVIDGWVLSWSLMASFNTLLVVIQLTYELVRRMTIECIPPQIDIKVCTVKSRI